MRTIKNCIWGMNHNKSQIKRQIIQIHFIAMVWKKYHKKVTKRNWLYILFTFYHIKTTDSWSRFGSTRLPDFLVFSLLILWWLTRQFFLNFNNWSTSFWRFVFWRSSFLQRWRRSLFMARSSSLSSDVSEGWWRM